MFFIAPFIPGIKVSHDFDLLWSKQKKKSHNLHCYGRREEPFVFVYLPAYLFVYTYQIFHSILLEKVKIFTRSKDRVRECKTKLVNWFSLAIILSFLFRTINIFYYVDLKGASFSFSLSVLPSILLYRNSKMMLSDKIYLLSFGVETKHRIQCPFDILPQRNKFLSFYLLLSRTQRNLTGHIVNLIKVIFLL